MYAIELSHSLPQMYLDFSIEGNLLQVVVDLRKVGGRYRYDVYLIYSEYG